jgi:hypothetical protein
VRNGAKARHRPHSRWKTIFVFDPKKFGTRTVWNFKTNQKGERACAEPTRSRNGFRSFFFARFFDFDLRRSAAS